MSKRIPLKYVQFHESQFVSGISLGTRIDTTKKPELQISYAPDEDLVYITFKGEVGFLHITNCGLMIPLPQAPVKEPQAQAMAAVASAPAEPSKIGKIKQTAQVSDPVRDAVLTGKKS